MRDWPSAKARRVLAALKRIEWLHEAILARISKKTGLRPEDL